MKKIEIKNVKGYISNQVIIKCSIKQPQQTRDREIINESLAQSLALLGLSVVK
jgi:hypothetical protein